MNKELAEQIANILRTHSRQINAEIGALTDEPVNLSLMLGVNDVHERKDGRPNTNMYYSFFRTKDGVGPRLIDEYKFYYEDLGGFRSGRP